MRCKRWKVGIQCCGNSNAHLREEARVQPVALFQQGTWSSQAFLFGPQLYRSDFHAGSRDGSRAHAAPGGWRSILTNPPSQKPAYGPVAAVGLLVYLYLLPIKPSTGQIMLTFPFCRTCVQRCGVTPSIIGRDNGYKPGLS